MKRSFGLPSLLTFSLACTAMAFAGGTCANFAGGACPASIPNGVTSFYFIDYLGGSDSNNGTSEATPWQHAPSMANATGNPAAHTSAAGEGWIFKGGVTVDYHAFPMNVPWGGTASNPTYMGVDAGWYTGASWTRPIFNGGGASGYDSSAQGFVSDVAHAASYVIVDNLEFTGLHYSSTSSSGNNSWYTYCYVCSRGVSGDVNWEVKNVYAHGWSNIGSGAYDPAGSQAFFSLAMDATPGNQSSLHDSVIDGSDSSKNCCRGSTAAIQYHNYYSYLVDNPYNGGLISNGLILFHDNYATQNVAGVEGASGPHANCFHVFAWNGTGVGGTVLAYNNIIDCKYSGINAEGIFLELTGVTAYLFNNVVTLGQPAGVSLSAWSGSGAANTYYTFNNTLQANDATTTSTSGVYNCGYDAHCIYADNLGITNNRGGASSGTYSFTGTLSYMSPTFSITCSGGAQINLGMTQICAPIGFGNGTGNLNFTETYPFAPMDATAAATVGTGLNHSAYCTAINAIDSGAGTACLSDSTAGVGYNTINHRVIWPNRTPIARPAGAWQVGAYEFPVNLPAAPTGLAAIVN